MKIPIFPGKYHQNGGFSWATFVSGRVFEMIFQSGTPQEKPNLLGRSAAMASMGQALGNSPWALRALVWGSSNSMVWGLPKPRLNYVGKVFFGYISNEGSLFSRMFFNLQGGWPPETFMTPSAVFVFMRKQYPKVWFHGLRFPNLTLPETYSLPLKIGLPNRKVVFQPSIFRCYVSFWDGT